MLVSTPNPKGDLDRFRLDTSRAIAQLASSKLGPTAAPQFKSISLSDLTASRLVSTDADKELGSADLASWVSGTSGILSVTDDGDGTVTLNLSDLTDPGADRVPFWDETDNKIKWASIIGNGLTLSGTNMYWAWLNMESLSDTPDNNSMMVYQGVSGGMEWKVGATLRTCIGLGTTDTPQFAGLLLGGAAASGNNPSMSIERTATGATNAHGIQDYTTVTLDATYSYAAFDARFTMGGVNNHDHFAGFQSGMTFSGSGTLSKAYGMYLADPGNTGGGTITANYGLYLEDMTAGSTNYGIYQAGDANNVLGGYTTVGNDSMTGTSVNVLTVEGGEIAGQIMLIHSEVDGSDVNFKVTNDYTAAASVDETASMVFAFGGNITAAMLQCGKEEDFTSSANRSAYLRLKTRKDGDMVDALHIAADGKVGILQTSPSQTLQVDGDMSVRATSGTSAVEQIRIGRTGSDIRYHSIYGQHSSGADSYLEFQIHDGGASPYTAQNTVLTLYGGTPEARVSGLCRATGKVRADDGFSDNGTDGIDTTFVDADGNTITTSGGLITAKTAP